MANGLVNLQTDLKSLKYGSMPLGSDAPYVTKNIGQTPGSQIGAEISHRIDDVSRIAKMLTDKPGIKYLLHEAELQQIGVEQRIKKARQQGKSLVGAVLQQVGGTVLNTLKIAGSTLAQVPVNGTGTHFLKGFRTDTYLQDGGSHSAFASFFGAGGVEGAQYALQGKVVPGTLQNSNFYTGSNVLTSTLPSLDLTKTTNTYTPDKDFNKAITPQGESSRVSRLEVVQGSTSNSITGSYGPTTLNIDQPTTSKYSGPETGSYLQQEQKLPTFNKNVTKEYRLRLGDQGAAISNEKQAARRSNQYWFMSDQAGKTGSLSEVDGINALAPQTAKVVGESAKVTGEREGRDIVKFRFHILPADGKETVLYFRAFLDSFTDNYSGQWNPVKYLGRAEDFQIYGGFQRKISLSFKIAAATRVEMKPLYQKMVWLASATAPTYANDGQFMRGTITKITVGDYIYELPGVLNSVTYNWNTEYPWEIAMLEPEGEKGDGEMQELPMVMDCSIDFTPIHTFTPETGLKKFITAGTRPENTYV